MAVDEVELIEKEKENDFDAAFDAYFAPDVAPSSHEDGEVIEILHQSVVFISVLDILSMIALIFCSSLCVVCFLIWGSIFMLMPIVPTIFSFVLYCLRRKHSVEVTEDKIKVNSFFASCSINICEIENVEIKPSCFGKTVFITCNGKIRKIKTYQSEKLYSAIVSQMEILKGGEGQCKSNIEEEIF